MTSFLGAHQPLTHLVVDDLEGDELAGRVPPEAGLQLPYLDLDAPGFSWPSHTPVGLPPRTPLEPADRLGSDDPGAPVQLKRDRNTLRTQADNGVLHHPAPSDGSLPTRRSLRRSRPAEPQVIRTITMPDPSIPAAHVATQPEPAPAAMKSDAAPADITTAFPTTESERDDRLALAEDLEAALLAAIDGAETEQAPTGRRLRLARAKALANGDPVEALPAAPSVANPDVSRSAMITAYGPFPAPRPTHRDFRPLLLLSIFLGLVGADRFYRGKHRTGALKLLTAGGLGIWWIVDIVSILKGNAEDTGGHRFTGEKEHRILAWALTGALFAGLATGAVSSAIPAVLGVSKDVKEALKPAPVPTWEIIAEVAVPADTIPLDVTGDRLRISHHFSGPVYAYLQKDGDPSTAAEPLLLTDAPAQGKKEIAVSPGRYQLIVRSDNDSWRVTVEELVLRG